MNKQQSPTAGTDAQAQQQHAVDGHGRLDPVAFAIEDDLFRATALNDLAHWVGKAQNFIASVRLAVEHDEHTKAILAGRGVTLYSPEWQDHHATGLDVLHMTVDDHLREVRIAAGIEKAPSAETTGARHEH